MNNKLTVLASGRIAATRHIDRRAGRARRPAGRYVALRLATKPTVETDQERDYRRFRPSYASPLKLLRAKDCSGV
jgi:hypothetical protein